MTPQEMAHLSHEARRKKLGKKGYREAMKKLSTLAAKKRTEKAKNRGLATLR